MVHAVRKEPGGNFGGIHFANVLHDPEEFGLLLGRQKHQDEASDVSHPDQLRSILIEGLRNNNVNYRENDQEHLDYDNAVWKPF